MKTNTKEEANEQFPQILQNFLMFYEGLKIKKHIIDYDILEVDFDNYVVKINIIPKPMLENIYLLHTDWELMNGN